MRNAALRRQVLDRDEWRCRNCGASADHVHHVVPLARGGKDVLGNLVSLCGSCHGAVHGLGLTHHSRLTKDGLAAARARGVKLGGIRPNTIKENPRAKEQAAKRSEKLRPVLAALQAQGASLRAMAEALAAAGTVTRTGQPLSPSGVKNHLQRLGLREMEGQAVKGQTTAGHLATG